MFDLVDLGEVRWLLGITVTRDRKKCTISLSQHAYIEKIAKHFYLENVFPVSTPLDPNVLLSKEQCPKTEDEKHHMKTIPYLHAIRSLMYAAIGTHIDIVYAAQCLSQFSSNPGQAHWTAVQQVI